MAMQAFVCWSVYVRTASVKKLKAEHLPPIRSALERMEFEFDVHKEVENPGLLRAVTYQNLEAETVLDLVGMVLRRAYRLADGWRIHGLEDLAIGELRHVMGAWQLTTPKNTPPALESMFFELEPGRILQHPTNGSWWTDAGNKRIIPG